MCSSAVFWQSSIINELNDRLSNNWFEIISAKISGNLFTSIKIEDVNVVHPSYGDMSIKRVLLNINFISSLIGSMTFDDIRVEDIRTQSLNKALKTNGSLKKYTNPNIPFDIDHFFISGQIPIEFQNDILILVGELEGSITGDEDLKVTLSSLKLNNQGENSITFSLDNINLTANQNGVFIDQFSGTIGNAPINGIISYLDSQSKFIGSINIDEFNISEDIFSRTPLKGKFSKLSGKVDFESVKGYINGNLSISNKLIKNLRSYQVWLSLKVRSMKKKHSKILN